MCIKVTQSVKVGENRATWVKKSQFLWEKEKKK
jgi:hypothetical protein